MTIPTGRCPSRMHLIPPPRQPENLKKQNRSDSCGLVYIHMHVTCVTVYVYKYIYTNLTPCCIYMYILSIYTLNLNAWHPPIQFVCPMNSCYCLGRFSPSAPLPGAVLLVAASPREPNASGCLGVSKLHGFLPKKNSSHWSWLIRFIRIDASSYHCYSLCPMPDTLKEKAW